MNVLLFLIIILAYIVFIGIINETLNDYDFRRYHGTMRV